MNNNVNLNTKYIGRNLLHFKEINSTNNYCKEIYKTSPTGTVVISDMQTKGRGKGDRTWFSTLGGIYFSILLKPNKSIYSKLSTIPLLTSVVICETLKDLNFDCYIKWPNDIILNGKKLGGILTESKISSSGIEYIIIGIGLNSNSTLDCSNDIKNIFVSLKDTTNITYDNSTIISIFLNKFESFYENFIHNGFDNIVDLYKEYCLILNTSVKVLKDCTEEHVKVIDILNDGSLLVIDNNKNEKQLYSGDVSIRGLKGYI